MRWNLSKKMAVSFFFAMIFTLLFGMLLLFNSTSREALRMNNELNQNNLEITRNNIERQIKNVEMSIIGIFFMEDTRGMLVSEGSSLSIGTVNKILANLNSLRAMVSDIITVAIYPVNSDQAVISGEKSPNYYDYESCIDYYASIGVDPDSFFTASKWVGLQETSVRGKPRYCFANIRILRGEKYDEPVAVMVVYYSERAVSRLYEFFGSSSLIIDKRGLVVSAVDETKLGDSYYESELFSRISSSNQRTIQVEFKENGNDISGFSTYLSSLDCYLIAVPDEILLRATKEATMNTLLLLTAVGMLFSLVFAIVLSRELTKPIVKLKMVMERARAGDLDARFEGNGTDEASYLGATFNILLDSINNYICEVKHNTQLKNEAEIKFLQSQINPHLLYNTLDSALYFISLKDNAALTKTVEELSKFFKLSLSNDSLYVELSTEIHHIRCYMELQRICRGKNIELQIKGDETLQTSKIVKTTFQPVVENAYLHAYEGSINDGVIEISISNENEDIVITITDDGVGIGDEELLMINERLYLDVNKSNSFGLWNVNRRLKACYGEKYGLSIESELGVYTKVTIIVPQSEVGSNV